MPILGDDLILDSNSQASNGTRQRLNLSVNAIVIQEVEVVDTTHLLIAFDDTHLCILYDVIEALSHGLTKLTQRLVLRASSTAEYSACECLLSRDLDLRVLHVAGECNVIADLLSRGLFLDATARTPSLDIRPFAPPPELLQTSI